MSSTRYSYLTLTKLEFSLHIFKKYLNIEFNENPPMGAELFNVDRRTDGRTDRHDEANSCFSQFYERA
jgi:hypothetical protein